MADKEFTQICKEILGIGKRLEKIEPEELREIKASIERANEAFNASKALFDESKNDFDGKYNKVAQIVVAFDTLKAQIEEVLKSGVINDDTNGLISTYSSKKIMDLLNEAKGVIDKKFSTIHKNGITPWNSTLEYPAGAISVLNGKLYQAKSENTNKNPSENKEIWSAFASKEWSEQTFLNKDDKIDAYTKVESDNKFARVDQVIGANQTTKVVTTQRALNVFYENTTDKPIMLYIDAWNNGVITQLVLSVAIGDTALTSSNTANTTAATHTNITVLIPPKTRYKVTSNGVLYSWIEFS